MRRDLESQLGPTLSRARTARVLGVSQTALDRWVVAGQIPVVTSPSGRREVPRQVVIELRESLDRLKRKGVTRHPLGAALTAEGHMHTAYAKRWRAVLALPIDQIVETISADSQNARDLRQSSPFAGVLNEHERRRIIEAVR